MRQLIKTIIIPSGMFMINIVKSQVSKRYIAKLLKEKREIFLDVGAGAKRGENGWTTIDMNWSCDIFWDLRKGIPFPDSSISKIYSSHFLEHLTFKEGKRFLDECLRVLTTGAVFSICVPNARIYIDAYMANSDLDRNLFLGYTPAYNSTTKIDFINYIAS